MKYIKIKENDCFLEICKRLNKSPKELEDSLLYNLEKLEVIEDSVEYVGMNIETILELRRKNRIGLIGLTLGRYDNEIADLFEGIVFVGKLACESCGLETERFTERDGGKNWVVERCLDRELCQWEKRGELDVHDENY